MRSAAARLPGLLLLVLLAACGAATGPAPTDDPGGEAGTGTAEAPTAAAEPSTGPSPAPPAGTTAGQGAVAPGPPSGSRLPATDPGPARPTRISVPAIDVDATMTDLGIQDDGTIEVPTDPDEAGWLDTTPAPGLQGPAVVAGHVDSTSGPAVFYRLASLEAGDEIDVTRQDGSTARFTVDGVRTYAQDDFPTAEVYGPVPAPALRLITCGGDYVADRGGYQDNVVVYAS